jgi:hypothetical protein
MNSKKREGNMVSHPLIHLVRPAQATQDGLFTGVARRQGSGHFVRTLVKQPPAVDSDPYLLALLADQELVEGREEQARSLIDAAYEAFDTEPTATIYDLSICS